MHNFPLAKRLVATSLGSSLTQSAGFLVDSIGLSRGLGAAASLEYIVRAFHGTESGELVDALHGVVKQLVSETSLSRMEVIEGLIQFFGERYKLSSRVIYGFVDSFETEIPLSIFTSSIGFLESITKYLHENKGRTFSSIASQLNRDPRTIWSAYRQACIKQPGSFELSRDSILVPLSALVREGLSVFEALVIYLKRSGMKYSQIGDMLGRDQRNVRTTYIRAIEKEVKYEK